MRCPKVLYKCSVTIVVGIYSNVSKQLSIVKELPFLTKGTIKGLYFSYFIAQSDWGKADLCQSINMPNKLLLLCRNSLWQQPVFVACYSKFTCILISSSTSFLFSSLISSGSYSCEKFHPSSLFCQTSIIQEQKREWRFCFVLYFVKVALQWCLYCYYLTTG